MLRVKGGKAFHSPMIRAQYFSEICSWTVIFASAPGSPQALHHVLCQGSGFSPCPPSSPLPGLPCSPHATMSRLPLERQGARWSCSCISLFTFGNVPSPVVLRLWQNNSTRCFIRVRFLLPLTWEWGEFPPILTLSTWRDSWRKSSREYGSPLRVDPRRFSLPQWSTALS